MAEVLMGDFIYEDYKKLTNSSIHMLCTELRPYQRNKVCKGTHDKKYDKMYEDLQLVNIGALGNGDYFLYSLKNRKMYESDHASNELIFPSVDENNKHLSFEEWLKTMMPK
jgi:hypothetical protein